MIGEPNQGAIPNQKMVEERPIGFQQKFQIPQYAENQDPNMIAEPSNPEPKPLGERLKKKILKVKREAVEELLALVRKDAKQFEPYQDLLIDFLSFNNVQVQDRGLKAALMYLSTGKKLSVEPKVVIRTVFEKSLQVQKQEVKVNSEQLLFWYMDNNHEEQLMHQVNENLMHRNKKIVGLALSFIANLLNNYGIQRLKGLKRFKTNLDLLSAAIGKPVAKLQCIFMFKEVFRWIGESVLKEFKMHDDVQREIIKFSKEYSKTPMVVKRGLGKQPVGDESEGMCMQVQEEQCREPIDVLNKYTCQWANSVFKIEKWKEKKQELDQFIKKIKVPKILPPREISHFIMLIKQLLADNNINISYCAFHITQHLANGLRKDFAHVARNIKDQIFNKLKDLKPNTVELAKVTLNSLLHCLNLQDYMDNIKQGLDDKSPVMRAQVLKLINNLAKNKDTKTIALLKTLTQKTVGLTQDGNLKVRTQAFDNLVSLKTIHGMKYFGDKLKNLDKKKYKTLELICPSVSHQTMDIEEQATKVIASVPQMAVRKQNNTVKPCVPKPLQSETTKGLGTSRVGGKNDENSSIGSNGQYKVARTLNLTFLDDISSPNEHVRANGYQQIANKYLSKDFRQFLKDIKSNGVRQSAPHILKNIILIAKKYMNNGPGDIEVAELIVKHDWKRCKQILQQFLQAQRFAPEADQLIKSILVVNSNNKATLSSSISTSSAYHASQSNNTSLPPFKIFSIELQNVLISKMSSHLEEVKKEAAERAIKIWQDIPKIANEGELSVINGWQQEYISKFFNVVKFRLSDSNPEIVSLYCQLLIEMLRRGVSVKQKNMKTVINTVYSNLKGSSHIRDLFMEMVLTSPAPMFLSLQGQIMNQVNQPIIIEFLSQNNQLFINHAELKVFMVPFLHILCGNSCPLQIKHKQFLDCLFQQMIEVCGAEVLEKQIMKVKVTNMQSYNQYLSKYSISLNKANSSQSGCNFRLKEDRIKYWEEQNWQFEISSSHIMKMANMMLSLGEPLSSLCSMFYLTQRNMQDMNNLDNSVLAQYSDIFFKFIYWRVALDTQEIVKSLLKFTVRLVISINFQITQCDIIVLMRTFIFIMERFMEAFEEEMFEIIKKMFTINSEIKDNTLQFWINYLMNNPTTQALNNQILHILIGCYEDQLSDNLVQLARIPSVHKNQVFVKFLTTKCHPQHLTASGFRLANQNHPEPKKCKNGQGQLLIELGGPENIIKIESSEVVDLRQIFMQNSQSLVSNLNQLSTSLDGYSRAERYVKMLYSILTPFFSGQISFINAFEFIKQLIKVTAEPYEFRKKYLRELTRMLLYMLVDMDEKPPHGSCQQMSKQVNRCILNILETSQSRHILQILFLLVKQHLQLNKSQKLIQIILKCIGKVIKYNDFTVNLINNISYTLQQLNSIIQMLSLTPQSQAIRTINVICCDLFALYPLAQSLIEEQISKKSLHPMAVGIYKEFKMSKQRPIEESLPEQSRGVDDVKKALNSVRNIGPISVVKLASVKKQKGKA